MPLFAGRRIREITSPTRIRCRSSGACASRAQTHRRPSRPGMIARWRLR